MQSKNVVSNFIWRFLERCGAQGVIIVVSIVLARLLSPEDYGTVALVTVFTTILQVFVDSGLGSALIQKKEIDDLDYSSVFFFNIILSLILYFVIWVSSPIIALFYDNPELKFLIRVASLTVIIAGVKNIQIAYVSRNMQFKKFFFSTLGGTIFAAIIGIYLACRGYGAWALVVQNVANQFIDTLILWITVKWRPKKKFSIDRLKVLYSFGWKLLVSKLIDHIYNELRQLIIGKYYSASDLAFFNKGKQFPDAFVHNVNTSIDSVLFPVLSSNQDDFGAIKRITKRAIMTSTYIIAPLAIGLAAVAEPFVSLLLTDKWLPSVPYLRAFCIVALLEPIYTANMNAIESIGRSDLYLKVVIWGRVVCFTVLFTSVWFGSQILAYSAIVSSLLCIVINSIPNKKNIRYGVVEQIRDIGPSLILALAMGIIVWLFCKLKLGSLITLTIQIVSGALIYILGSIILKIESYDYFKNLVISYIKRK